jgi:hypothetical protein
VKRGPRPARTLSCNNSVSFDSMILTVCRCYVLTARTAVLFLYASMIGVRTNYASENDLLRVVLRENFLLLEIQYNFKLLAIIRKENEFFSDDSFKLLFSFSAILLISIDESFNFLHTRSFHHHNFKFPFDISLTSHTIFSHPT